MGQYSHNRTKERQRIVEQALLDSYKLSFFRGFLIATGIVITGIILMLVVPYWAGLIG